MSGIKIYNVGINGIHLSTAKSTMTFKSWVVSTLGGVSDDRLHSVIESSDGNLVAVGYQKSQSQYNDALVVKYDNELNAVSQYSVGRGLNDKFNKIIETSQNTYIAVGESQDPSKGNPLGIIVEFDQQLNITKSSGLGSEHNESLNSIVELSNGTFALVGYRYLTSDSTKTGLIIIVDDNFNIIEQKVISGSSNITIYSIDEDNNGNIIVAGEQQASSFGSVDGFIIKLDSSLNIIEQRTVGGTSTDYFRDIKKVTDGYIIVGYQSSSQSQGGWDALIIKYDNNLNLVAQAGLGGPSVDQYYSVCESNDGGYIAVGLQASSGEGQNDALIVKYDNNLNIISSTGLGGASSDQYLNVIQSQDGSYVAVGYQNSQTQGTNDALIVKHPTDLMPDGVITNHMGLTWSAPSLIETVPSLSENSINLSINYPGIYRSNIQLNYYQNTLSETKSVKP